MQPSAVHSGQYAQNKISSAVAQCSTAKPDPFFGVEPNFGPILQVESDQVGPQGQKTGPIGSHSGQYAQNKSSAAEYLAHLATAQCTLQNFTI